jgi:hypothetical protein
MFFCDNCFPNHMADIANNTNIIRYIVF